MARGKGEGTIYKRPDGRWEARVVVGRTVSGNPKRRGVYGKTRKEVAEKLNKLLTDHHAGRLAQSASQATVQSHLELWLSLRTDLEAATIAYYQHMIRAYINPGIGEIKLTTLTPLHLEHLMANLARKGLSVRTVEGAYKTLSTALAQAVRWELIPESPIRKIKRPPRPKSKRQVWSKEQARQFLKVARTDRLYALYLLAILTGLRRGELLGLRWQAVNFEERTVQIQHTLIFVNGKRHAKDKPKTSASERCFKVSGEVLTALRARQEQYALERQVAGADWQELGYVFCSRNGTGLYENTLRASFKRLTEQAQLPRLTPHEMRHTFTSLALLKGADIKEISRRLGHSTVQITLDIYQHLFPEQDEKTAFSSDELLGEDDDGDDKSE